MANSYYTRDLIGGDTTLPPILHPSSGSHYPGVSWQVARDPQRPSYCPLDPVAQAWDQPRRSVLDGPFAGAEDSLIGRVGTPPYGTRDLGMPYPPRPTSPNTQARRQMLETQDQLRMYKEELAKRDKLIGQLTSLETPRPKTFDTSKIDEMYSADKQAETVAAKTELSVLQVKVEGLQSELRDVRLQLEARDDKIRELTRQSETVKEGESCHAAIIQSLRSKIAEYEAEFGQIEGTAGRSEVAITTLQRENQEAQKRILDLEAQLRQHGEEREEVERHRRRIETQLNDMTQQLSSLGLDGAAGSLDYTIESVRRMVNDTQHLKVQNETNKEQLKSSELELKAARETIMRLAAEAERERQSDARNTLDMEAIRLEKDKSISRQRELEQELELLNERLDAGQRSWTITRRDLEEATRRVQTLENDVQNHDAHRRMEEMHRSGEAQHQAFKEALARLLTDDYVRINADEEQIGQRVETLIRTLLDRKKRIDLLEQQVSDLSHRLNAAERESAETMDHRSKHNESRHPDMRSTRSLEESLRHAENELAAGQLLRDQLRADKENFLQFLEVLSRKLLMDPITSDMGLDGASDAIVARIEQVMRNETTTVQGHKTHVYNLNRKIKSMKEQIDSKDLHMDLLRKKVTALEERLVGKTEVEREKDSEYVRNRKLIKLVEKYKCELNEAHVEIRDLKARLLEISEMQTRVLEKDKTIEILDSKVNHLESIRQKQADKLANMQGEYQSTSQELVKRKDISANTISALTSELRTTKQSYEEIVKREHQLLDLRQVIARMLGLNINSLSVPDYEIVSRLEKLVLANQANAATAFVLDSAIADMGEGFRAGYHDAAYALADGTRGRNNRHVRSVSPHRKLDAKAY